MTDIRRCDGPNCNLTAPLEGPEFGLGDLSAESFITVECKVSINLHFHNKQCLVNFYTPEES